MKKIVLLLLVVMGVTLPADAAKLNLFERHAPGTARWYILNSDVEGFKKILPTLSKEDLEDVRSYAPYICPTRSKNFFEPKDPICNEDENAEIVRLILERIDSVTSLEVEPLNNQVSYKIRTVADRVASHNVKALPYILAKMDKCQIALSQMQGADDSKPNWYVYADYWRNNKCTTKKFYMYPQVKDKQKKKLYSLIGANKKAVQKAFGKEPTVYERPSEHREVLTYKDIKTYKVGDKGEQQSYHLNEWQTVFTIDRDVVTDIKHIRASDTRGGEETRQISEEERQQRVKEERMKNSAIQQAVMQIMFGQNK